MQNFIKMFIKKATMGIRKIFNKKKCKKRLRVQIKYKIFLLRFTFSRYIYIDKLKYELCSATINMNFEILQHFTLFERFFSLHEFKLRGKIDISK